MYYYVYVLQSTKDRRWYTGFTVDIRKRLKEHSEGKYTSWTKCRGPFELIYYEVCKDEVCKYEVCKDKQDARNREIYLKTGMGKRYLQTK